MGNVSVKNFSRTSIAKKPSNNKLIFPLVADSLKWEKLFIKKPKLFFASTRFILTLVMIFVLFTIGCNKKPPASQPDTVPQPSQKTYEGTIVALGDSLTAGLGVMEREAYPARLAQRIEAAGYHYHVVNAGVSGETSSGMLSRIDWIISSLVPDIVILETGANDGMRGLDLELIETNLDRLVTILKDHQIQVVLAGMQMLPNLGPAYVCDFSQIYPQVAERHGVILIPFFLEGVAARDHLNQADSIHPNADGHDRIAQTVYPYVVEAIQKHRSALAKQSIGKTGKVVRDRSK